MDKSSVSRFAEQLAASASRASDSNSTSSFSTSSPQSGFGGSSSPTGSSPGMVAVSNPFFVGNLSSSDQDRLRQAFSRF